MDIYSDPEKRLESREPIFDLQDAYVEIILTYPNEHKIYKPVVDISTSGVSFCISSDESFLLPGTPLKKVTLHAKNQIISNLTGEIRHLTRHVGVDGKVFTKVGLKLFPANSSGLSHRKTESYPLRPQRFQEEHFDKCILLDVPNGSFAGIKCVLLNFSKFGVAFEMDQAIDSVMNSAVLRNTKIFIGNEIVYDGPITIKSIRSLNGKLLVGASVVDQLVNINKVIELKNKSALNSEFKDLIINTAVSAKISSDYKGIIADARLFLESVRSWLTLKENMLLNDISYHKNGDRRMIILDAIKTEFGQRFNLIHQKINELVNNLDETTQEIYKHYYQKQLHELLLTSPLLRRIYLKPCGYAGDYETIDMLIGEPYIGDNLFSKLISWYIWQVAPAQAHRNRIDYLLSKMKEFLLVKENAKILTLGSGPAKELQNLISELSSFQKVEATLIDFDSNALLFAQDRLLELKILLKKQIQFVFQNKSVIDIIREAKKSPIPKHDFIYCTGLFDYLTTSSCTKILEILYEALCPSGILLVSNVHSSNEYSSFMEFAGEWYIFHRSEEEMLGLMPPNESVQEKWIEYEETKTNIFLLIRKKHDG